MTAINNEENLNHVENGYSTAEIPSGKPPAVQYELQGQTSHNILSYDTKTLVTYGWIFTYRGSIFHKRIFVYILVQFILSSVIANYKCQNTGRSLDNSYCVPLPNDMTALTLLTVTSFLVGLFTNNVMQRWWQIRTALNNVKSKSTNLVLAFTSCVAINTQNSPLKVRSQAICMTQTVTRYLQLAHALIYIRANPVREYNEQLLRSRNLLTQHEAELLLPKHKAVFEYRKSSLVYSWVLMCLEKASTSGILGPVPGGGAAQHVVTLFNELSLIQSAAADVDMFISTQLPYPFIQMTSILGELFSYSYLSAILIPFLCDLVYVFLFQLFFVTSGIIGDGFINHNPAIYLTGYCTQILMTFVMLGILHLYLVLSNP